MTAYQREAARREAMRQERLRLEVLLQEASSRPVVESVGDEVYRPYRAIRRYWLFIVACVILGGVVVGGARAVRAPTYSSTSTVTWNANYRAELPALYGAPSANVQPTLDLATAAVWVRGDVVMASAGAVAGVAADKLRNSTTVNSSPSDETVTITVRASSAEDARSRADAVTNSFVKEARNRVQEALQAQAAQVGAALQSMSVALTSSQTADLRSNEALLAAAAVSANGPASVVQSATEAVDTRGTLAVNAAIGAALGLILGLLLAFGVDTWARRRRGSGAE